MPNAVFHFFSASKLCDVRVWYLNMIADGVFNIEMNGDQLDLKNSIDSLAKKATENEHARKVDCYILNMYDDMLQERFSYSSRSAKIDKVAVHTDDDKDSNKHESPDNLNNKPDLGRTSPPHTKGSDEGMITRNKTTNEDQPSKTVDIHENSGSVKNVDLKSDTDENVVAFGQTEGSSSEDITDDKIVERSIDTRADKHTELTKEQENLDRKQDVHISELDKSGTKDTKFDSELFSDGSEINYDETDIHTDETETTEEHRNVDQVDDVVNPNQDDIVDSETNILKNSIEKEQEISNCAHKGCNESENTPFDTETSNKNFTVKRTEYTHMPYGVCAHACCVKLDVFDNFASTLFLDDINAYESPQDKILTGIKAPFGVCMKMESLKSDIFSVHLLYHSNNTGDNQTMESKAKRKALNATGHAFNATEQSTSCPLGNYCDKRCYLVYSIAYCTLGNNNHQSVTESRENSGIAENKNNEMNVQEKPDHIASPEETLDSIDESIHISNNNIDLHYENSKATTETSMRHTDTLINKENIINSVKFPYERLEQIVNQSTGKCNEKIQMLELIITKLENQVLVEKLNKQNHSSTITRLENMILKLENDLLRMYRNYETLRDDFSQVNNKQNTYLKIAERQEQQMKKYPELPNKKLENLELISKHQERISELSQFINNHSDTLHKMQSRSEYLEEQNRILQQMIMNQSNFMATLMQNVQNLAEQNLKQTLEMNEIKQKVSNIQASDSNLYMQSSAFLSKLESLASVEKIQLDKIEVGTENVNKKQIHKMSEDTGNVDNKYSKQPKFSDSFVKHWCSFNSINTNPCLYESVMHLKDCIPYKNVFWLNCTRNLTIRNVTEKGEKEDIPPLPMISSNISDQSIIKDTLEEKQKVNLHFKGKNAQKSNTPTVKINKALDTLQVTSDNEKETRNSISDENNILDTTQSVLPDNKDEDKDQAILPNSKSHRVLTSDKTILDAQIVAREKTDQHETTDSSNRMVNPSSDNEYKTQDKLVNDSKGSKIEIPKVSDKNDDSSTLSKKEAVKEVHEKKAVKDEHEKESVKEHKKEAVKEVHEKEYLKELEKEAIKEERENKTVKEEHKKENVKEQEKEDVNEEHKKDAVKEVHDRESIKEHEKEAVKEHEKEPVKEQEKEAVKDQEKETVKEQEKEPLKEQEKEIAKEDQEKKVAKDEHEKEATKEQEKEAVKEQEEEVVKEDQEKKVVKDEPEKEAAKELEKEAVKDEHVKEVVKEQEKEAVKELEKNVVKEDQEKKVVKDEPVKEAVKELEKEAVKEHEKEAMKEHEKEAVSEQKKETVKEGHEKEDLKEQEKEAVKEQEKEAVKEGQEKIAVKGEHEIEDVREKRENEAVKEQEKGAVEEERDNEVLKEQEKEAVKEQEKEAVKEQEKEAVKEHEKEAVKEHEKEAVKVDEKEVVKEQEKDAVIEEHEKEAAKVEQEKEAVKEQEKEAVIEEHEKEAAKVEQEKEAVKEHGIEAVKEQEKEAVKEQEKEAVKEHEKEAVKEQEKEAVKEHEKEAVKVDEKEVVKEQEKETVKVEHEKEAVKGQEKDAVKEEHEKEAAKVEQEKEAVKEQEKEAVKDQEKEAVKEQEKEAVKEQEKEAVKVEQEKAAVQEQEKEAVKEQEKEAVKEQEKESVKEQEKEAVKEEQEKEAMKEEREKETVKVEQEKEAVKEREKEAVKEQKKEAVKEDQEKKAVKDEHEKEAGKEHEKKAVKEEIEKEAVKEHEKEVKEKETHIGRKEPINLNTKKTNEARGMQKNRVFLCFRF